jgi:hypothetical protein
MRISLDGSRHISTTALDHRLVKSPPDKSRTQISSTLGHRLRQLERDEYVPARVPVDLVLYCNLY